jgi:23S rRNA (adenine2503-C2)-methyltransferase
MNSTNITEKINLIGLTREELAGALASLGLEKFRTNQIWQWLYHHGVRDVHHMTNIAQKTRELLQQHFFIERPTLATVQHSVDGTIKWLYQFADGNKAETVYIPEEDRGTLCISSQVGCTLTCTFCHTGTQKLVRNLTASEIIGQVLAARDALDDWPSLKDNKRITNIVLMGMGEPLFNYENVAKAITIATDNEGVAFSRKRITLSTSGHVPYIKQCADELGVNLAISLHAVRDELRDEIVPLNKRWNIAELLDACRYYAEVNTNQRITFEYVMLKGVNDSDEDAHLLVKLLSGIPAKVNMIPFNSWEGSGYERSSNNRIHAFGRIVQAAGYASPIRTPRGEDIMAACGQLKSDSEKLRKSDML